MIAVALSSEIQKREQGELTTSSKSFDMSKDIFFAKTSRKARMSSLLRKWVKSEKLPWCFIAWLIKRKGLTIFKFGCKDTKNFAKNANKMSKFSQDIIYFHYDGSNFASEKRIRVRKGLRQRKGKTWQIKRQKKASARYSARG